LFLNPGWGGESPMLLVNQMVNFKIIKKLKRLMIEVQEDLVFLEE
jgi:hypothetical protein